MRDLFELYNVSEQYLANIEELIANEELPPEVIADTIESLQGDVEEKAINVASYIKNLEVATESMKRAAEDIQLRYCRLDSRKEKLKTALKSILSRCDIKKINTPHFDIKLKINPPKIQYESESDIPAEYWREKITRSPNLAELKEAIKNGQQFAGIRLISDTSITIK